MSESSSAESVGPFVSGLGKGAGHAARQSQGHNCSSYVPTCHDQRGSRDRLRCAGQPAPAHGSGSVTCPEAGLALQLLFCFEVRALGGGLVSSTPE